MPARIAVLTLADLGALALPVAAQPGRELPPEVQKIYEQKPVVELVTMGVGGLIWDREVGHPADRDLRAQGPAGAVEQRWFDAPEAE